MYTLKHSSDQEGSIHIVSFAYQSGFLPETCTGPGSFLLVCEEELSCILSYGWHADDVKTQIWNYFINRDTSWDKLYNRLHTEYWLFFDLKHSIKYIWCYSDNTSFSYNCIIAKICLSLLRIFQFPLADIHRSLHHWLICFTSFFFLLPHTDCVSSVHYSLYHWIERLWFS